MIGSVLSLISRIAYLTDSLCVWYSCVASNQSLIVKFKTSIRDIPLLLINVIIAFTTGLLISNASISISRFSNWSYRNGSGCLKCLVL